MARLELRGRHTQPKRLPDDSITQVRMCEVDPWSEHVLKTGHMLTRHRSQPLLRREKLHQLESNARKRHLHTITPLPAQHSTGRRAKTCITEDIVVDPIHVLLHDSSVQSVIPRSFVDLIFYVGTFLLYSTAQSGMCENVRVHKCICLY